MVSLSEVSAGNLLISGTSASSDFLIFSLNIYRECWEGAGEEEEGEELS